MSDREWQPIETAPKDGMVILTFSMAASVVLIRNSFWDGEDGIWRFYTSTCGQDHFDPWFDPTHWMPLPPAPSRQKEDA